MELIKPEVNVLGECPTKLADSILWIEKAGRICYRSEDKIIEGSGSKFVEGIVKRGHLSVIEHSNLVVRHKNSSRNPGDMLKRTIGFLNSDFLHCMLVNDRVYIGGNYRAHMEVQGAHSINEMTDYFSDPHNDLEIVTDHEEIPKELKMITAEFVTDRAVTHEIVRHRPSSYSQESQRYVRYNNIQFIEPSWYGDVSKTCPSACTAFLQALTYAENKYRYLIDSGLKAEDARVVLPNATATRIVMTASIPEWMHVFNMRCSRAAYPSIRSLMTSVRSEFMKKDWII